jgi:hypothetical protein
MGFYDQSRCTWGDYDSLGPICQNSGSVDFITDFEVLEFVNRGILSTTFEIHLCSLVFLVSGLDLLWFDLLQLLINCLPKPLKALSNTTNAHVVYDDISIW